MAKRLRRLVTVTMAVLLVPIGLGRLPAAFACSCLPDRTYDTDIATADVVFDGVATERIDPNPSANPDLAQGDTITWRFDVDSVVKGAAGDPQDVGTARGGGLCGTGFDIGTRYRVFARREGAELATGSCSGNRILAGYRLAASDGGVFAYGASSFHGSAGGLPLQAPVVGIAATPSGRGYWLAAADGGVFAYGDAPFLGSAVGQPLAAAVVGMTASPTGLGYWLVAADGGVFAFGDARFFGSAAGVPLQQRVIGIAATGSGGGYWLAAADGGVFAYGDAGFFGNTRDRAAAPETMGPALSSTSPTLPRATGITASHTGTGYWISSFFGDISAFDSPPPVVTLPLPVIAGVVGIARTSIRPGFAVANVAGDVATYYVDSFGDIGGRRLAGRIVGVAS